MPKIINMYRTGKMNTNNNILKYFSIKKNIISAARDFKFFFVK